MWCVRIALLADLHMGFGFSSPREADRREDSFIQAEEALRLASERADVILIAGDLFDRRDPGIVVLERASRILNIPHRRRDSGVNVSGEGVDPRATRGVPIIAVHGNHDTRSADRNNVLSLFHEAGVLVYVHGGRVVLEKGGERVAVTGVGWIPDSHAEAYFRERIPPPLPGAYNVLLFHQPLKGLYPYRTRETLVDIALLPRGYDVYVTGHFHYHTEARAGGRWIVIPGSTVRTQLRDREVLDDRAFYILDTKTGELEEVFLQTARRGFLYRISVAGDVREKVRAAIEEAIRKNDRQRPPIVKIVIEGTTDVAPDVSYIVARYRDRAVVRVFDQTTSVLSKKLKEIGEEYERERELFSEAHALATVLRVLQSMGVQPGKDFSDFMAAVEAGQTDRALKLLESGNVFGEGTRKGKKEAREESTPSETKPVKGGSSILDWVGT